MSVEISTVGSFQKKLDFTVPLDQVKREFDNAYRDLRGKVRMRGFRPGKAPRQLLEARFGAQVSSDVATQLIQKAYEDAVSAHELEPVGRPVVDEEFDLKPNAEFQFTVRVDVKPTIEVKTYTGVDVVYPKAEVSAEELDMLVRARAEGQARLVTVERKSEAGDMVLVTLVAKDGDAEVANEPGTMIRTEADPYYPGVESLVLGLKAGDKKSGEITFDESARNEDVAGRTLTVEVEVMSVQANEVPEVDDALAEELGYEGGVDGMRAALKEEQAKLRDDMARNQARANMLQALIDANPFEVPSGMIDQNVQMLMNELRMQQAYRGIDPRTVTFNEEQIADLRVRASFAAKAALILEFVTDAEKISVSDEDLEAKYQELADERGQTVEAVRGYFIKDDAVGELRERLLEEKALDWLLEKSNLVDEAAPKAEAKPAKKAKAKKADKAEASGDAPTWNKSMKKDELLAVAKELGLDVNSKMKKADIVAALESA